MHSRVAAAVEDDWRRVRDLRLEALADAPTAFGSTLAQAREMSDERWRSAARGSVRSRSFLAWIGDQPVGMAGILLDDGQGRAEVVALWVRPDHRGRGVGRQLMDAAMAFASACGQAQVHLWVTQGNGSARALYERLGFRPTGASQPASSDPSRQEHELEASLGGT